MRILFFLLPCSLFAQNLVVNGSFERETPYDGKLLHSKPNPCCFSSSSKVVDDHAYGWVTFDEMTPDLIIWDTINSCPAMPKPHSGNRMVGLIMYHPFQDGQFAFDYHEVIQGSLAKPLEKGKTYRVSFWVRSDDSLGLVHLNQVYGRSTNIKPVHCGNFGFYFSKDKCNPRENLMESQVDFPVHPQINLEAIVDTKGLWRQFNLTFKADQPYRYLMFGNFFFDAVTPIDMAVDARMQLDEKNQQLDFWHKTKRIGYYCFDDFSITEISDAPMEKALLEKRIIAFQAAVLFDTGKFDLKPEALPELQRLAAVLKENSDIRVEIGGHTDNVGDDAYNQTLSEQRAKAVCDFLLQSGITDAQLSWQGYGEQMPVASNKTEEGRQQNRRVTCKILD